jgi:[ribosomal protein S5]-alanine N-acetyltransferase
MIATEVTLRRWRKDDRERLAQLANNRNVSINLRDVFPFPYTLADAKAWIAHCEARPGTPTQFAIAIESQLVGGIGFEPLSGVYRICADIGYWIAEPYWGRGIATAALLDASRRAFAEFPLERLEARVFAWNPASMRVLEKAGYQMEGRMRHSVIKDGQVIDSVIYALLRS